MIEAEKYVQDSLMKMSDEEYRVFQMNLIPNIIEQTVIGVRIPLLRRFAKKLIENEMAQEFMVSLPHKYYDENNLHVFLIEQMSDFDCVLHELERFLPYVDNWATCDLIRPYVFKRNTDKLIEHLRQWICSQSVYTVRFAICTLMNYFLDEAFELEQLDMVAGIESSDYYINMARSWYFAEALAAQYDSALPYLEQNKLDLWTHNKTIQKALDSKKISAETKVLLRKLKRKQ